MDTTTPTPPARKPSERYGPNNPHPLSTLKTELVWEGKYDDWGNRREVDLAGSAMPLQKIETIDEPRARAEAQGDLFDTKKAHLDDFRNMLIWGDNKLVMASLSGRMRGQASSGSAQVRHRLPDRVWRRCGERRAARCQRRRQLWHTALASAK
jgi:hypothetical protein